jgi:hypothetical protein
VNFFKAQTQNSNSTFNILNYKFKKKVSRMRWLMANTGIAPTQAIVRSAASLVAPAPLHSWDIYSSSSLLLLAASSGYLVDMFLSLISHLPDVSTAHTQLSLQCSANSSFEEKLVTKTHMYSPYESSDAQCRAAAHDSRSFAASRCLTDARSAW